MSQKSWAVLVAGGDNSAATTMGSEMGYLPHLLQVCDAFNILQRHMERDHIIVIARVRAIQAFLFDAAPNASEPWRKSKQEEFLESCSNLNADGGADYDDAQVNPTTVVDGE